MQIKEKETKKNASLKLIGKISDIENCPTCLQKVDESHKNQIISKEKAKLNDENALLEKLEKLKKETANKLALLIKEVKYYE